MTRTDRIKRMERSLEITEKAVRELSDALDRFEASRDEMKRLFDYYGSTKWMGDLEADEAGKLPADLKRGVLSEDAVWDLIAENRELVAGMARIVADCVENGMV